MLRSLARCSILSAALALLIAVAAQAQEKKPEEKKVEPPKSAEKTPDKTDRAALEKKFEETMSGSVLVGAFSVTGKDNGPPKTDRYTIVKVSKLQGDTWLFLARIEYGNKDITLPMPLEVKWAGDTPVITLTDLTLPKMGTFTSRVMVYRDQYAGTWQHDAVGGHMWGKIERAQEKDLKGAEEAAKNPKGYEKEEKKDEKK
jgi:hypothetical protein